MAEGNARQRLSPAHYEALTGRREKCQAPWILPVLVLRNVSSLFFTAMLQRFFPLYTNHLTNILSLFVWSVLFLLFSCFAFLIWLILKLEHQSCWIDCVLWNLTSKCVWYVCVCVHVFVCVCMSMWMCVCVCMHVHIYIYVCVCASVHVCVHSFAPSLVDFLGAILKKKAVSAWWAVPRHHAAVK